MTSILVVDDTEMDRRLIGGLLEKQDQWSIAYAVDGSDALRKAYESAPDVIVSDVMMPELNGLDLVSALRDSQSRIPVILVTAHGNETMAVEALEKGAASYVPKPQLSFKLVDTVKQVLSVVHAQRTHDRLVHCLSETESTFHLENAPELIPRFAELALQMADAITLCGPASQTHMGMALAEALLNAMLHGNLEFSPEEVQEARSDLIQDRPSPLIESRMADPKFRDRRVYVQTKFTADEARFVIRDEGSGFDVSKIPQRGDPGALESEAGRGLVLMGNFMDEVNFNEKGTEVTMVKRREGQHDYPSNE